MPRVVRVTMICGACCRDWSLPVPRDAVTVGAGRVRREEVS